jgi:TonB family protein
MGHRHESSVIPALLHNNSNPGLSAMSTTLTPFAPGHFEIRFRPPAPPRNSDAWQKLIGEKPIGARLEPLPEHRTNWRALATSTFTQVSIVIALVLLQIILPPNLITKVEYEVMPLAGPLIEIPESKPQPVRPKIKPQSVQPPAPEPQHIAKLIAPRPLPSPKPKPIEVRTVEIPKVEEASIVPKLDVPDSQPVKPREVKTGLLGDSPAGGGFGDPHGLPGAADPSKQVNIAHVGAFDSTVGPGNGSGTGNGNGAGGRGGRGNGNGVAGSGFGDSSAFATGKNLEGPRAVQTSGFQSAEMAPAAPAKSAAKAADAAPATEGVALLSKPNPVYTEEARRLGIEGEVLLDVVFLATGQIKINGVVKGLGHGLDEAAVRAAQQIRFKPAIQEGHAVDFPATVHMLFQLAF